MERSKIAKRCVSAIVIVPVLLVSFVWLEEIAKGSELHYLMGHFLLNRSFVEIMFVAFIPLAIGTFLLLFSRIDEAPRLLKCLLYVIAILALISTLIVAHSLATVPRGGKQSSFSFSIDDFSGNITKYNGVYFGEDYDIVFTKDYPTSMVIASSSPTFELSVRLQTAKPVNLRGTLYLFMELHRLAEDPTLSHAVYYGCSQEPVNLNGSSLWTGRILTTEIRWGSNSEQRRMRLEGYRIVFRLQLRLEGADHGEVIPFAVSLPATFSIIDFRVDSALQNGVAVLLCGIFAGIYIQILGKPVIKRLHLSKTRKRNLDCRLKSPLSKNSETL